MVCDQSCGPEPFIFIVKGTSHKPKAYLAANILRNWKLSLSQTKLQQR